MRHTPGLKLVMAVSDDGFVARGPTDDMSWTPPADKEVFRLLTGVGGVVGVGHNTARHMPGKLSGRRLHVLSTSPLFGVGLGAFAHDNPGAWLAGGQTIAKEALTMGFLDEVHLCRNQVELGEGRRDLITPWLQAAGSGWHLEMSTRLGFGGVEVEVWRRGP